MGEAAADRALVAHLHVADVPGAFRKQRTNLLQQIRRFDLIMRGHRADPNLSVFFANVREVFDAADIYEKRRLCQTELHSRNQTVSAGEEFCVFVLGKQIQCFIERVGARVIKLGWNHAGTSSFSSASIQAGFSPRYRTSGSMSAPFGQTIVPASSSTRTAQNNSRFSRIGSKTGPHRNLSRSTTFCDPFVKVKLTLKPSRTFTSLILTISSSLMTSTPN